jgi:hypothetical protein
MVVDFGVRRTGMRIRRARVVLVFRHVKGLDFQSRDAMNKRKKEKDIDADRSMLS